MPVTSFPIRPIPYGPPNIAFRSSTRTLRQLACHEATAPAASGGAPAMLVPGLHDPQRYPPLTRHSTYKALTHARQPSSTGSQVQEHKSIGTCLAVIFPTTFSYTSILGASESPFPSLSSQRPHSTLSAHHGPACLHPRSLHRSPLPSSLLQCAQEPIAGCRVGFDCYRIAADQPLESEGCLHSEHEMDR